jgi:Amino acid transporters
MNAVILTSILSAGNSGLYAASRMLHSMALKRQAPAIFARVTKGGVPAYAMAVTTVTAALGFLTQLVFNDAYIWLVNIVGISGIIMWLGIAVSHIRFRRAYLLQGYRLEDLPYRSPFFPAGPIIAFVMCLVVMAGQNYEAVLHGQVWEVASSYIGLPLFGVVWWGYHVARKDRVVPLAEMDVAPVEIEPVTR